MNSEIERFGKAVAGNQTFREKVKTVGTDPTALVKFANQEGYGFSVSDVDALSRVGELSDSDLEQVAGGFKSVLFAGSGSGYVYVTKEGGNKVFVWF